MGRTILIEWSGFARSGATGVRELVGRMTHITDDVSYSWLNDRQCAVAGEVRPKAGGDGVDVIIEVAELVWEPLGQTDTDSAGSMPPDPDSSDPSETVTRLPSSARCGSSTPTRPYQPLR
jgi:hypothetical protein